MLHKHIARGLEAERRRRQQHRRHTSRIAHKQRKCCCSRVALDAYETRSHAWICVYGAVCLCGRLSSNTSESASFACVFIALPPADVHTRARVCVCGGRERAHRLEITSSSHARVCTFILHRRLHTTQLNNEQKHNIAGLQ